MTDARIDIEPGQYLDVEFEDYCNWDAMNQSTLKDAAESMAHLRAALDAPPRAETPAHLTFGSLVHAGILEPLTLLERYVVMPDFADGLCRDDGTPFKSPRASNAYKDLVADFCEQHPDQTVVSAEAYENMRSALQSLATNDLAKRYLSGCLSEVSICWIDADSGVKCKARLDGLNQHDRRITDVKTAADVSDRGFSMSIVKWGYDVQSAFYLDGLATLLPDKHLPPYKFCIVALESVSPFCTRASKMNAASIAAGRAKYKAWLAAYAEAMRTGTWPGYPNPTEWSAPDWALATGEPETMTIGGQTYTL
ncbi:MAG: hypothetical protein GY838_03835 [bacterium]|nr:hypothetical protein [bacterium]